MEIDMQACFTNDLLHVMFWKVYVETTSTMDDAEEGARAGRKAELGWCVWSVRALMCWCSYLYVFLFIEAVKKVYISVYLFKKTYCLFRGEMLA